MGDYKLQRKTQRTTFTKTLNEFNAVLDNGGEEAELHFMLLKDQWEHLEEVNTMYMQRLQEEQGVTEKDILDGLSTHLEYKTKFFRAKLRYEKKFADEGDASQSTNVPSVIHVQGNGAPSASFKRPVLDLIKFNGSVGEWLQFWSHFKKYHEDPQTPGEEKLRYLKAAMVKDSKADIMIKDYPSTAQNYENALKSLKDRFGRPKSLIQYYVRKLLILVIQNANGGKKVDLATIYDQITAHFRCFESLGIEMDKFSVFLYPLVESSLPEDTLRAWQRSGGIRDTGAASSEADVDKLLEFLRLEVEGDEGINMAIEGFSGEAGSKKKEKSHNQSQFREKKDTSKETATASTLVNGEERQKICIFCDGTNHESVSCFQAKKMSLEERKRLISEKKCCFKCIKFNHRAEKCRVKVKCSWCSKPHCLLMCPSFGDKDKKESDSSHKSSKNNPPETNLATFSSVQKVYLQTLRIILYNGTREKIVRALIDQGSMRSYISQKVAKELGYDRTGKLKIVHSLFGGVTTRAQAHNTFLIRVKDLKNKFAFTFEASDQDTICGEIPSIERSEWINELERKNISLSDFSNEGNDNIEVLIGGDIAGKLMTGEKIDLANGLTVFNTALGWVILGKIRENLKEDSVTRIHSMLVAEEKVSDLWRLDTLGITDPIEKINQKLREQRVKENFLQTVSLTENSQFTVDLPWKEDHAQVSQNLQLAKKRLDSVVKQLEKTNRFRDYDQVFEDWLTRGIIEIVPDEELNDFGHYLPHRPVFKEVSTTKVRPVFDASAHEKGYPSLNQCLETGPNLIELIPSSILQFRKNKIGVIADVFKAFLHIKINKNHRNFLRFFWYRADRLVVFRHLRVVFGLTCSPFIMAAVFELIFSSARESILKGEKHWSLEGLKKLEESFYVDNCATSVENIDELNKFMKESTEIMETGGFKLRGWEFTNDDRENEEVLVLGILFNKTTDTLSLNPSLAEFKTPTEVTKRVILSFAHKPYDPIGSTCPATLTPRILLKTVWKLGVSWDEVLEGEVKNSFLEWVEQMPLLIQVSIPRSLCIKLEGEKLPPPVEEKSIHCFVDASAVACAAVVFLRIEVEEKIELKFLGAKTRLVPEKLIKVPETNEIIEKPIPRLELLAALIGSRLTHGIIEALKFQNLPLYFWSDSSTVLAWISRDLQWGTFVYNRVKEIREKTQFGTWFHIPGEMNPADLPSRGCTPQQLIDSRWWEGPEWLKKNRDSWPNASFNTNEQEITRELKKSAEISMVNLTRDSELYMKFSSYEKIIRFLAIMIRFKNFILKKETFKGTRLTFREILETELKLLRQLQREMFLPKNDPKLASFRTFVHSDRLIRVNTRITERKDEFPFLNPIILDGNHEVVKLIVREAHEKMCHAGVQRLMCHLREKFWILSIRKIAKSVVKECIVCKKEIVKAIQTIPAPLPNRRVRDACIFEVTGVDFAGPIFLKGRQKGWICLYTCAVYRAVHLELVTSLSTNEFLGTLRRFIARRGRPNIVYSDNGTNFMGSDNAFSNLNWESISKYSSARQID